MLKIFTITCHDVYNVGASLQAYALQHFLRSRGADAFIIDYKPEYLSSHYRLWLVGNPKYNRPIFREAYLLAKLPDRIRALRSEKKRRFDEFRNDKLYLTKRYKSFQELCRDCPTGDCYIAGSDQIWNPFFPNGKDPAFFLQFAPQSARKIAYAASFGVSEITSADSERMQPWLKKLDAISVREKTGLEILSKMSIPAIKVCDPVFLLDKQEWESMIPTHETSAGYILLYDFDKNPAIEKIANRYSNNSGHRVCSILPTATMEIPTSNPGPLEFLGLIKNASLVLTNSFHAIVFSLLFQKEFYAFSRKEPLNSRMIDLLRDIDLEERFCYNPIDFHDAEVIQWDRVVKRIEGWKETAISFLERECLRQD